MIRLAVLLSSYVGCSLRQVPKALEVVSLVLGADLGRPVSHVTVKDWLEKCGLAVYDRSLKHHTAEEAYALIVDNSISLGGQDLHVQLSVPAAHPGHALRHCDVSVERIAVCQGWSKADTERELNATVERRGRLPEYAVNDNGRVLYPVFDQIGIPDHRDISHSFALCLEKAYAPDLDFREFIAKKGYARKFSHTKWAHLMPPKRPEFARFMNVFATVDWAKRVLDNDFRLSHDEAAMLSFVKRNASLVEELHEVMTGFEHMLKLCKTEGLSRQTAQQCRYYIHRNFMGSTRRVRQLGQDLLEYFDREEALLGPGQTHIISSDVIESTFGFLKGRMSPNKNNGYTPIVLMIPLHMALADEQQRRHFNVCELLANTTIRDVKQWRWHNLLPNPLAKRQRTLQKVG